MTPVRNEAWILKAFLTATSLWADYIIIADQCSTDGSREIALSYPKVILIDNNNPEFNESERQSLLINKAREIEGDKILFGLDADEIFTANFTETNDWQKILNSKPGDVFWFKWAFVDSDLKSYWSHEEYFPWMFHDDGIEPHGNYVRNIHSMRIPYPIDEKQMFYVNDFKVFHFHYVLPQRVNAKSRFYKFVDYNLNKKSIISLSRMYSVKKNKYEKSEINKNWLYTSSKDKFDLFSLIDITPKDFWYDKYILQRLNDANNVCFSKLDIWDKAFLSEYKLNDSRSLWIKLIHNYLKITKDLTTNKLVKVIDKALKEFNI